MRDPFRPPPDLEEAFRRLCAPFGGSSVVQTILPAREQEYLLLFPGFVYVVSSWAPLVDLTEHGYEPGSVYSLYDHRLRFLYAERCDGTWGKREHDRELLTRSDHGSYVHICFRTRLGPKLGIFWIATRPEPERWRYMLDLWQYHAERARPKLDRHEIFFETYCLPTRPLRFYFLPGRFEERLTPEQIRDHPDVQVQEVDPPYPLVAYPETSGWITFYQGDDLVVLSEVRGNGVRRLRTGPGKSLYVHLGREPALAPHPVQGDYLGQLSGSAWAGSEPLVSVTATLKLAE